MESKKTTEKRSNKLRSQKCEICGAAITFPDGVKPYRKKTCSLSCASELFRRQARQNPCPPLSSEKSRAKRQETAKARRGTPRPASIVTDIGESMKAFTEQKDPQEVRKKAQYASECASRSPLGGQKETNANAKHWTLQSPNGTVYEINNLQLFARKNYFLFGFESVDDWEKICGGFGNVKQSMLGKREKPCYTYKGWYLLSFSDENTALQAGNEQTIKELSEQTKRTPEQISRLWAKLNREPTEQEVMQLRLKKPKNQ